MAKKKDKKEEVKAEEVREELAAELAVDPEVEEVVAEIEGDEEVVEVEEIAIPAGVVGYTVKYEGSRNEVWSCKACGHNHMPQQFHICEGCHAVMVDGALPIPPKIVDHNEG